MGNLSVFLDIEKKYAWSELIRVGYVIIELM